MNSVIFFCRQMAWSGLFLLLAFTGLPSVHGQGQDSDTHSAIDELDQAVSACLRLTNASAATVAVSRQGELLYTRGYGFSDRRQRVVTTPRNSMRLASCTKPFTCAAIRRLIELGMITDDLLVFDYLGIEPIAGELVDERIRQITVAHLLNHRGGWDRAQTLDPMYGMAEIKRSLQVGRLQKYHIVRYMWSQPLQFDPGSAEHYSNFGYLLLGLVIEKATGKSYIQSLRELVGEPAGIDNLWISSPRQQHRRSREIWYPTDNELNLQLRDSASGLSTTAESLCKFMDAFWLDGLPRDSRRNIYLFQFGNHPHTTTTLMEQRLDGLNYAIMLNSRREEHYHEDNDVIRQRINEVLDQIASRLKN